MCVGYPFCSSLKSICSFATLHIATDCPSITKITKFIICREQFALLFWTTENCPNSLSLFYRDNVLNGIQNNVTYVSIFLKVNSIIIEYVDHYKNWHLLTTKAANPRTYQTYRMPIFCANSDPRCLWTAATEDDRRENLRHFNRLRF